MGSTAIEVGTLGTPTLVKLVVNEAPTAGAGLTKEGGALGKEINNA